MKDPDFDKFNSFLTIVSLVLLAGAIYIVRRIFKYVVWGA